MQFYKIHSLGNDFVIFGSPAQKTLPDKDFIKLLCDRHYGIGADCAVFIGSSQHADFFMHVFNPDGFEAEICGNALRCSAKYVTEKGFFKKRNFVAETLSGMRSLSVSNGKIRAEIGAPRVESKGNIEVCGVHFPYVSVSLGNPHCVILVAGLRDDEFSLYGSRIENHPMFPNGTNVEFAAISSGGKIAMRVWERGIGETLSCSTGSCACVAAAIEQGCIADTYDVYQPGGVITVNCENNNMYITGECTSVFKGELIPNKH